MTTSLVDTETILGIDIGTANTRALLFDVVDGQYNFIASGSAPSTADAPYHNPTEGMIRAVRQLQEVTGRDMLEPEGRLIIPIQGDGSGVDRLVVTYSTGEPLKVVVAGLLSDVSLDSARRLAASTYAQVVESVGLNDRRRTEAQMDAIIRSGPELVLFAGGTDGGASRSVGRLLDLMTLVCKVLPQEHRPEIIYAGNQNLSARIKEILEKYTTIRTASNIRPSIDLEDLSPAQSVLSQALTRARLRQMPGLATMASSASALPMPTAYAFGRVIRFLSKLYNPAKGVLGVDLGAASTILAAGLAGKLDLFVSPFGVGQGTKRVLEQGRLDQITQWLPVFVADDAVRDYLWQKTLYPASLPTSLEGLAIEQALARHTLRLAMQQFQARYPLMANQLFDPIFASGAALSQAANPIQTLLMLLDGLQPAGVTTLVLDQNGLTPTLGAISEFSPLLPVQVFDSGAYLRLCTVVTPLSGARYGTPILEARLEIEGSSETKIEVRKGSLVSLPLQQGQVGVLYLKSLHGTLIDPRSSKNSFKYKIHGGACGAVIDGRGRPLALPQDASRRRDLLKKWSMALGG